MIVRLEAHADRSASIEVERAAFERPLESTIVEAVRDEAGSFALVAEIDGDIVGHVQMSRAQVGETDVLALGPIGVLPDRQQRGIGSSLVRAALEEAGDRGKPAVILLGDPSLYGPLGFAPGSRYGLRNPFGGMQEGDFVVAEEDFQIAVLDEARAARLAGAVRWHPAFG
ncbi:MAG TPA: N-acetyltransferase [Actinomycetota bacterium]|nr:N-acetyltransferase [Actinomycetota bacterium]